MQFPRRMVVLLAPLMIVGGIALATMPAQAATSSPAKAPASMSVTVAHSTGDQNSVVTPAEPYIWVEEGTYPNEEECEEIGLDYYEDGYAADYECEPAEVTGGCSNAYILWIYIPQNLADAAAKPQSESTASPSAC